MANLTPWQNPATIQAALKKRTIAVVGLSPNERRPSHGVADYMMRAGYEIIPVNPREETIFGLPSYPSLTAIPGPVDVVNVFRESSAVPEIAREACTINANFLWLQFDVISAEGVEIAETGGLKCIVDRCIKIEHARYQSVLN